MSEFKIYDTTYKKIKQIDCEGLKMDFEKLSKQEKEKVIEVCKELNKQQLDNFDSFLKKFFKLQMRNNVLENEREKFLESKTKQYNQIMNNCEDLYSELKLFVEEQEVYTEILIRTFNQVISNLRKKHKKNNKTTEELYKKLEHLKKVKK